MDRQFHLLDSFPAKGSDGAEYKVCAYEHLKRDESIPTVPDQWLPTGQSELRLATGELIDVRADGTMVVAATGVTLTRAN